MDILDSWKLLKTYKFVEVWKTPTKYLVCYHYGGVFKYCTSYSDALKSIKEVYDQSLANLL